MSKKTKSKMVVEEPFSDYGFITMDDLILLRGENMPAPYLNISCYPLALNLAHELDAAQSTYPETPTYLYMDREHLFLLKGFFRYYGGTIPRDKDIKWHGSIVRFDRDMKGWEFRYE